MGSPVVKLPSPEVVLAAGRYLRDLRRFLREPLTPGECRRLVEERLSRRSQQFISTLEAGVFDRFGGPYARLLGHARITRTDVVDLVRTAGVEHALRRLADAGVYVSYEEYKGRVPVTRGTLEFSVGPEDFDNHAAAAQYRAQTAGSRGVRRRAVRLDLLENDAAYHALFLEAFGLRDRPMGLWRPVPPGLAGWQIALRHAKVGRPVERWFSHNAVDWTQLTFVLAIYGGRLWGAPLPVPQHVPLDRAGRVAEWLSDRRRAGVPALLDTNASSGVRICLAALERGLDISGTVFSLGGEPYTPAKAAIITRTGSAVAAPYTMNEIGRIGLPCAAPADLDDNHVAADKLAVVPREKSTGAGGTAVRTMLITTLRPVTPKLMLNVETDDTAILEERDCGCLLAQLGMTTHLRRIRSDDKLTSEGMKFDAGRILALIEEELPARFGGHPTDYQFVEEEEGGLPRISIVVSPRVGSLDEERLVHDVFTFLESERGSRSITLERWREARTFRVVRCEPYATGTAKILPLHVLSRRP
jgi:hypothetical protein